MKKIYNKPLVKKIHKGKEIHPVFIRYDESNPLPASELSKEEIEELHTKVLLKLTPTRDLATLEKHFKGGTNKSLDKQKEPVLRKMALIAVHRGDKIGSGKGKISQYFSFYSKRNNRISPELTKTKTINKINLFEEILPSLSEERQKVVNDEINLLRTALKENF
jgi:hypothetical protein